MCCVRLKKIAVLMVKSRETQKGQKGQRPKISWMKKKSLIKRRKTSSPMSSSPQKKKTCEFRQLWGNKGLEHFGFDDCVGDLIESFLEAFLFDDQIHTTSSAAAAATYEPQTFGIGINEEEELSYSTTQGLSRNNIGLFNFGRSITEKEEAASPFGIVEKENPSLINLYDLLNLDDALLHFLNFDSFLGTLGHQGNN